MVFRNLFNNRLRLFNKGIERIKVQNLRVRNKRIYGMDKMLIKVKNIKQKNSNSPDVSLVILGKEPLTEKPLELMRETGESE